MGVGRSGGDQNLPAGGDLSSWHRPSQRSLALGVEFGHRRTAGLRTSKSSTTTDKGIQAMLPENRPPTHPGEMLLEEFPKPVGMTQSDLAKRIHVSLPRVNEIINGRRGPPLRGGCGRGGNRAGHGRLIPQASRFCGQGGVFHERQTLQRTPRERRHQGCSTPGDSTRCAIDGQRSTHVLYMRYVGSHIRSRSY